jgi:hypothetical protein
MPIYQKGEKKVDNSSGLFGMGGMSEGKERIVAEHPKAWAMCGWWRARVEGCGEDAVLVERAFGAVFEASSERGSGVKKNFRGGGEVVF